jgi:hypothetical protein
MYQVEQMGAVAEEGEVLVPVPEWLYLKSVLLHHPNVTFQQWIVCLIFREGLTAGAWKEEDFIPYKTSHVIHSKSFYDRLVYQKQASP